MTSSPTSLEEPRVPSAASSVSTVKKGDPTAATAEAQGTNGLFVGFLVITKTMIGSGLLGIAWAMKDAGFFMGSVLLALSAVMTWFSLHLLSSVCMRARPPQGATLNFATLSRMLCPKIWFLVDVGVILLCFGSSVAYLQISGQLIEQLVTFFNSSDEEPMVRRLAQIGCVAVCAPLVLAKALANTSIPNMIGLGCLVYILFIAVAYADLSGSNAAETSVGPTDFVGIVARLPTFFFAFCCQQNMVPVIKETRESSKTVPKLSLMSALSTLTGVIIMAPVMLFPYATFGEDVADVFLKNLDRDQIAVQIAFIAAAVSVMISFPLLMQPTWRSIVSICTGGRTLSDADERRWRLVTGCGSMAAALTVALLVNDCGLTMSVTGLLGANSVSFVSPSFFFLCAFSPKLGAVLVKDKYDKPGKMSMVFAWVLFVSTVALYPIGLAFIFVDKIRSSST